MNNPLLFICTPCPPSLLTPLSPHREVRAIFTLPEKTKKRINQITNRMLLLVNLFSFYILPSEERGKKNDFHPPPPPPPHRSTCNYSLGQNKWNIWTTPPPI